MSSNIVQQFDGYEEILKAIEHSRKYGLPYSAAKHAAQQYVDRLHPPKLRLRVADILEETPSTKTIRLVSEDGYVPPFQAGQYVALLMQIGPVRTSRPYSISSPPNQRGHYDITVRRVEGGLVSNQLLDQLKQGDPLESSGPAGTFFHNPLFHDRTMVCLAGGSGITPFMSMIREIVECGLDRTVVLFHGGKTLEEAIFHRALSRLSHRFENIRYVPVIENPPPGWEGHTGLITGNLVRGTLRNVADKTYYLCGPKGMYDFCIPELEKLGIPRRKIRKEVYGAPMNPCADPAWPDDVQPDDLFNVVVKGRGEARALASQPLLVSLEEAGMAPPSICRSGECSLCRVKVLSGKVFQPAGALVRKSDRRYGYVHACVSFPLEDLEILI